MLAAAASTVTLDANTIILAIIGLVPAIFTGLVTLWMAKIAAAQKEQKVAQVETTKVLESVHTAVNSGKTILENKIDDLIKQNVELAKKVATLEESKRGAELAKAVADVKPVVVTPATVVPAAAPAPVTIATTVTPAPGSPTSPLKEAIADLTEAAKDTVTAADKTVEMVVKVPHA